jgi:hypothetical protein
MKKLSALRAVEMKDRIQAELCEEQRGLSDEDIERRRHVWLETSDDAVARWWRSARRPRQPT